MATQVSPPKNPGETKRMANLLATKPLNLLMEEARETGEHSLKRTLGVFQLTALGVGAIIGAGIFVMVGLGAQYAGPGCHSRSFCLVWDARLPDFVTPSSRP